MAHTKIALPPDSTLRTIVDGLASPEEFVRSVFSNMRGYHRDCQVRLALDGSSRSPDYRIDMLFDDVIDGEEVRIPQATAVYFGRTHKGEVADGSVLDHHWSAGAMRWEEVQQLLGELRGKS